MLLGLRPPSYDFKLLPISALKNSEKVSFNKDNKIAGKDWLLGFKSRHPQLRLRKPKATQITHQKILLRGRKQVGCLTSAERENTIQIRVCFNAAGA